MAASLLLLAAPPAAPSRWLLTFCASQLTVLAPLLLSLLCVQQGWSESASAWSSITLCIGSPPSYPFVLHWLAQRRPPNLKLNTMFASNKLPTRDGSPAARSPQLASMYNDGNDDIATMNRFTFPAISFSPSFPLDASPRSATAGSKCLLSPRSPGIASGNAFGNALSPRSPHRSSIAGSSASSGSLPGANAPSRSSSTNSNSSVGHQSLHPSTPCSPLPPLSPRGQKLADSENYHKNKCLTRIVEKRRKASDGTQDIVYLEPATPPHLGHLRRVSFKLSSQCGKPGAGSSMPSSLCWSSQATAASSSPGSGAYSLPVGVCDTMPAESAGSQSSHPSSISPFEIRFSLSSEDMDGSDSPSSSSAM